MNKRPGTSSPRAASDAGACRPVLIAQGGYYVVTGLAPFVSRRLFEAVTGPKHDWWLVQTVGGVVTVVGGALLSSAVRDDTSPEVIGVAVGSAVSLGGVELVYVAKRQISPAYLLDAAAQIALLVAWISRSSVTPGSHARVSAR